MAVCTVRLKLPLLSARLPLLSTRLPLLSTRLPLLSTRLPHPQRARKIDLCMRLDWPNPVPMGVYILYNVTMGLIPGPTDTTEIVVTYVLGIVTAITMLYGFFYQVKPQLQPVTELQPGPAPAQHAPYAPYVPCRFHGTMRPPALYV